MSNQTKIGSPENFADKVKSYLRHPGSMIMMLLVMLAAIITFAVLIVSDRLYSGTMECRISNRLCSHLHYTSENASLMPALINTVIMTLLSLADRSTVWNFFSDLPCRICRKREINLWK